MSHDQTSSKQARRPYFLLPSLTLSPFYLFLSLSASLPLQQADDLDAVQEQLDELGITWVRETVVEGGVLVTQVSFFLSSLSSSSTSTLSKSGFFPSHFFLTSLSSLFNSNQLPLSPDLPARPGPQHGRDLQLRPHPGRSRPGGQVDLLQARVDRHGDARADVGGGHSCFGSRLDASALLCCCYSRACPVDRVWPRRVFSRSPGAAIGP